MDTVTKFDLEFDVLIIGAGPAGLSCAIKLAQQNKSLNICILEKSAAIGAHILSGAVLNPSSLKLLFPDLNCSDPEWQKEINAQTVTNNSFYFLTENHSLRLPTPSSLYNQPGSSYLISLSQLCRWLAKQAENLNIQIFPGFSGYELIFNSDKTQVLGVHTGDQGRDNAGKPMSNFQPGVNIKARYTMLAEGCRGSLTKQAIKHFKLAENSQPQTYGLGIKEIWQLSPEQNNKLYQPGMVMHSMGWPLDHTTYGGSFVYHYANHQVAVGFITGLDYQNPTISPFNELQRFKHHPIVKDLLTGGKRIAYGARAINEGGYQSVPKLIFPGGALLGCSAGLLNVSELKGIHNAIYSGMYAAQAILNSKDTNNLLTEYPEILQKSELWANLYKTRNIRPGFRWGLLPGVAIAALETYITRGKLPITLKHNHDNESLKNIKTVQTINYPKPDNKLSFDRLSSLMLANLNYHEPQPCHLKLNNLETPIKINYQQYGGPEQYYCPANVYEFVGEPPYLQINATNCIHCKACDIKDPTQNINWTPPEGGDGPFYNIT